MTTIKQKIYGHYLQLASEKVQHLQQVLDDLKQSGSNETKSTAGDKHETALAMLQIEQEQKRAQLKEAQIQKAAVEKINPAIIAATIVTGSLIKTNKDYLFMSAALGKAVVDAFAVTALSPQSPLGKQLMGLTVGGTAVINNNEYFVEGIE
jgi:transcription elongation GreA/GreB family factor